MNNDKTFKLDIKFKKKCEEPKSPKGDFGSCNTNPILQKFHSINTKVKEKKFSLKDLFK